MRESASHSESRSKLDRKRRGGQEPVCTTKARIKKKHHHLSALASRKRTPCQQWHPRQSEALPETSPTPLPTSTFLASPSLSTPSPHPRPLPPPPVANLIPDNSRGTDKLGARHSSFTILPTLSRCTSTTPQFQCHTPPPASSTAPTTLATYTNESSPSLRTAPLTTEPLSFPPASRTHTFPPTTRRDATHCPKPHTPSLPNTALNRTQRAGQRPTGATTCAHAKRTHCPPLNAGAAGGAHRMPRARHIHVVGKRRRCPRPAHGEGGHRLHMPPPTSVGTRPVLRRRAPRLWRTTSARPVVWSPV